MDAVLSPSCLPQFQKTKLEEVWLPGERDFVCFVAVSAVYCKAMGWDVDLTLGVAIGLLRPYERLDG